MQHRLPLALVSVRRVLPNRWDLLVFPLVVGLLAMGAVGLHESRAPLSTLRAADAVSLDPWRLPEYALLTTLRMLAAMAVSLVFTLAYGTIAAKSRRAAQVLVPALDILQSVPVLGYVAFTVTFFLALAPGRVLGAEAAAVFAIFSSQAWNMAFGFYQSLRTLPRDLQEVSANLRLTGWQRFWKLEVPFAMPGLVWNMMMSMSGGWFFVVASEALVVGNRSIVLPGVGAYLAEAIARRDLAAVGWVVLAMALVILAYDQLLFRPLIAWSDKFRVETSRAAEAPQSWLLDLLHRTRLVRRALRPAGRLLGAAARLPLRWPRIAGFGSRRREASAAPSRGADAVWFALVGCASLAIGWRTVAYVAGGVDGAEVPHVLLLGGITLARVAVLVALASAVWLPLGVWIGLRPALAQKVQPLAQFLAAFPANLLFPVFVLGIVHHRLNPDLWLSPLIVLGTQWYILFNVIAGASAYPNDLREACANFGIRGGLWWRRAMLPAVFPYYLTGVITAAGGAWNAAIVSEAVSWGDTRILAHGLGAYIAEATARGDYPRIILGIAAMALFVTAINRLLWRPLMAFAERRLRID